MAPAPIAVIVYEPGAAADATLAVLAHGLAARGLRVSGLVQHNDGACALPGFSMALEDIATRRTIPLVDPGIVTPHACRLDVSGLAEAATLLAPERHAGSDVVVVNKFGRQESLGRGLRDEMAALALAGLPLLTSVRVDLLPAFAAFTGGGHVILAPQIDAVMAWLAGLAAGQAAESCA